MQCETQGDRLINRKTGGTVRALMPVHLYGQSADMDPLMAIARQHGLRVIEDAAQAIGTEYSDGVRAGTIGDVGCFSFFPSKNLGAFGDAGLCTTNDAELAETMRVLRVHGGKPKYFHALIGGNFRIDELQAAVLRVKLKYSGWLDGRQAAQCRLLRRCPAATPGWVQTCARRWPRRAIGIFSINMSCGCSAATRSRQGSPSAASAREIYYPVPLHLQKCFAYLGYRAGDFPQSEQAAAGDSGVADLSRTGAGANGACRRHHRRLLRPQLGG